MILLLGKIRPQIKGKAFLLEDPSVYADCRHAVPITERFPFRPKGSLVRIHNIRVIRKHRGGKILPFRMTDPNAVLFFLIAIKSGR